MKTKLFIPFILVLFLWGCKEEQKIEIIPNLEADYLSESEVDKPAEFIKENSDAQKSINDDLISAIKSIHDNNIKDTLRYIIKLRFFINEYGKADKIKDISTLYDRVEYSSDGIKNYTKRGKMNEALSVKIAKWQFEPAKKEGKNVKSWVDNKGFNILAKPDGRFEIEMPDFPNGLPFGSTDKYLISADVMPEVVGGIVSIQNKIVYPELAKRAGIEGKVYVLVFIDERGDVNETKVIKGIGGGCDEAAVNAIKQIKFVPGKKNGQSVKVQVTIPIVFKLQ
jgi:periplasmic protein TonB